MHTLLSVHSTCCIQTASGPGLPLLILTPIGIKKVIRIITTVMILIRY